MTNSEPVQIAEKRTRLTPGELDKLFIEYYLETASPKQAYIRACKAGGHDAKLKYAKQYGAAMFNKLRKPISDAIDAAEVGDAALSRMVRREIAQKGKSESARLSAASGLERKRAEKLEIKDSSQNIENIDAEISLLQDRIKQGENKP